MRQPSTKAELYKVVHALKRKQCRGEYSFGVDVVDFTRTILNVNVVSLPYKTKGLRGMAIPGTPNTKQGDIIFLNSGRDTYEQNFDCAHEMMHLCLHRDIKHEPFVCADIVKPQQNGFLEWQANEGAAEYCVPYAVFLYLIRERYDEIKDAPFDYLQFIYDDFANIFKVPSMVIKNRMENLKYEIYQYIELGTPLDEIEILSNAEQRKRHISVNSLYDKAVATYDYYWANA